MQLFRLMLVQGLAMGNSEDHWGHMALRRRLVASKAQEHPELNILCLKVTCRAVQLHFKETENIPTHPYLVGLIWQAMPWEPWGTKMSKKQILFARSYYYYFGRERQLNEWYTRMWSVDSNTTDLCTNTDGENTHQWGTWLCLYIPVIPLACPKALIEAFALCFENTTSSDVLLED